MIKVNEVMNVHLITIGENSTIAEARQIMHEKHIRHIPVLNDTGKLVGLVTQRDVLKAEVALLGDDINQNVLSGPIQEILTRNVAYVHPEDSLRAAGLSLQKHKYGCLPVVKDEKLVGIITDSDFVGVAIDLIEQMDLEEEFNQDESY